MGLASCHAFAYCLEPDDGVGYSCKCDENYFSSALQGTNCDDSGLEIVLILAGPAALQVLTAAAADPISSELPYIVEAREKIMHTLIAHSGLLKPGMTSVALLLEGVHDYPVELVSENSISDNLDIVGRSLWRVIIRVPSTHLHMHQLATTPIFDTTDLWDNALVNTSLYRLNTKGRCLNDRRTTCSGNRGCLNDQHCNMHHADIQVRYLSAGGSTAPLVVQSSGMQMMSLQYDSMSAMFKIRMRYDHTIQDTMDLVYVSRIRQATSQLQAAVFATNVFPCSATANTQMVSDNSGEPLPHTPPGGLTHNPPDPQPQP